MGLPCPNIFAGEHAFHSRLEWVSVQDMEKAVQTIVHLAMIWEERAKPIAISSIVLGFRAKKTRPNRSQTHQFQFDKEIDGR